MDRFAALEVLTDSFVAGLKLNEEDQVFGSETRLEFEPLPMAFRRSIRKASVDTIRLTLAGDASEWELDRWDILDRIGRWRSEGIAVELVVPSDLLAAIDAPARNRLAGLIDANLAKVVEAAPEKCTVREGLLIAELGGEKGSIRFAVKDQSATIPGEMWGVGTSSAFVLRDSSDAPLRPPIEMGVEREAASLRSLPPGTVAAMHIDGELNGPIELFGERFWDLTLTKVPELAERLSSYSPIAEVIYEDRYVRTPLMLRAFLEVARALKKRKALNAESIVRIITCPITGPYQQSSYVSHNWDAAIDREQIFANAAAAAGFRAEIQVKPRPQTRHARELKLVWTDGATWRIRLDEGLGFLWSKPVAKHDFSLSETGQSSAMAAQKYNVVSRNETVFYAFGVDQQAPGRR